MLLFCPSCGNLLRVAPMPYDHLPRSEAELAGKNYFTCRTCPYQMLIQGRYYEDKPMKTKEVEDVLGGADSWKNVDKTQVNCTNASCENREAYFRQVQIRSADEPMTTFYKCTLCASEWREN